MVGTTAPWTPERRARQREIIRCTKPWTRSTGPRTPEGKAQSSRNAMLMRNDPEARLAYDLTHQFLSTGIVPPALGEIWLAAYLNPVGDEFCSDMLGFFDASVESLDEHQPVGDLVDSAINYVPGDVDGDDWLWGE